MTKSNNAKRKRKSNVNGDGTKTESRKRQKRTNNRWRKISSSSLPKFLDAESSVTAAKFGARRLPEMKSLWRTFLCTNSSSTESFGGEVHIKTEKNEIKSDTWYYESGGCKSSQRHLRRRTGSFNRKKRHRFPAHINNNGYDDEGVVTNVSTVMKSPDDEDVKKHSVRNSNVRKGQHQQKSRRARRKPLLLRQIHSSWKNTPSSNGNASNWLETHLWHTKRFHVSPPLSIFNNWCIPLGHSARGSRAALRLAKTKSTIQDATWAIGGNVICLYSKRTTEVRTAAAANSKLFMQNNDLIRVVERICGGKRTLSAPFLLNANVLHGSEVGYGFIYNLEHTFPSEIIGPAAFLFGFEIDPKGFNKKIHQNGSTGTYFCKIMVHSSILETVQVIIKNAVREFCEDKNNDVESVKPFCNYRSEPLSLLKVRGINATDTISRALHFSSLKEDSDPTEEACMDWIVLSQNTKVHTMLKHGTVIPMTYLCTKNSFVKRDIKDSNDESLEKLHCQARNNKHDIEAYIEDTQEKMTTQGTNTRNNIKNRGIVLVSQCPNKVTDERTSNVNITVSGWDIWCDPCIAKELFIALNDSGGACSIGLIEASTLAMEAHPPLPLWPRDFPDSPIGRKYWSENGDEWKLFRYCIEEGMHGGRIKTIMHRLIDKCGSDKEKKRSSWAECRNWMHEKILWENLEDDSDGNDNEHENKAIIVIRGSFTLPIMQALSGWCPKELLEYEAVNGESINRTRRPRHKVKDPSKPITIPPLSRERSEYQKKICSALLTSLSISTLLRCHVIVSGKGKLSVGMEILPHCANDSKSNDSKMGFIVSGMFSQSKGYYHGVGFVSSKQLIGQFIEGGNGCFVLYREIDGSRDVGMRIRVWDKLKDISLTGFIKLLPN